MKKLWILGVLNDMVKIHGEAWLVQVNEGQEQELGSLDDQMNLDVSSKGTHHSIRVLESE